MKSPPHDGDDSGNGGTGNAHGNRSLIAVTTAWGTANIITGQRTRSRLGMRSHSPSLRIVVFAAEPASCRTTPANALTINGVSTLVRPIHH